MQRKFTTPAAALVLAVATLGAMLAFRPDLQLPGVHAGYQGSRPKAAVDEALPGAERWAIVYHGTCCEGNLAAAGDHTYVLLPELTAGNDILRSSDSGLTWDKRFPPVDASAPYGIEGDLQAWGNDVIYFGTELAVGVVAVSSDAGETFTTVQVPVVPAVNDQAWSYLGPLEGLCPAPVPQSKPYVLAGWFRIGAAVIFSCDGGLTWPIQTPLVGNNGSGPRHVVCEQNAVPAADQGDTRLPDPRFASLKAGRHGSFGTDRRFYWTEVFENQLYVCRTDDFGLSWEGNTHPVADGPATGFTVTHTAFDEKGTLYLLHGDKLYVSFDQGHSFRYVHTLPRYDTAARSDSGGGQYFAVHGGRVHLAIIEAFGEDGTEGRIGYLRGRDLDTDTPRWHYEPVDVTLPVRLDFMQIALNGRGVPTLSYTTPDAGGESREVTTASLKTALPYAALLATPVSGAAPLEVTLDASASSDLEAEPLTYAFDFGDGSTLSSAEAVQRHTYAAPGGYTASVTVTNPLGQSSSAMMDIRVDGAKRADARFGGALSLWLLAGLFGLTLVRRHTGISSAV